MSVAVFSLAALATELKTDPANLGYASFVTSGNDTQLAQLINATTFGTLPHSPISGTELLSSILPSDLNNLTTLQLQSFWGMVGGTGGTGIAVGDSNWQAYLTGMFTALTSPNSHTAITGLATQPASRAEVLWGVGTVISISQIGQALLLP
jgi:hypothetical protein